MCACVCMCVCVCSSAGRHWSGRCFHGRGKTEWHLALCSWHRAVSNDARRDSNNTPKHTNTRQFTQVFLIAHLLKPHKQNISPRHTHAHTHTHMHTLQLCILTYYKNNPESSECRFSPSGKLCWPLPRCTCLWGFICMQSYQMGAEVLADAHTHTHTHTHTTNTHTHSLFCGAAFLPSLAVSSPSSPAANKSRFHKAGCDRHSLKQTFHSVWAVAPSSTTPTINTHTHTHTHTRLFSLLALHVHVVQQNHRLMSNLKLWWPKHLRASLERLTLGDVWEANLWD